MEEYILVQDNSLDWYVIPSEKSDKWCNFCDIPEEDEASWDVPEYAKAVGGCQTLVKFKNFKID